MSAYAEYNHGLIDRWELINWFNLTERPYMDDHDDYDPDDRDEYDCDNEEDEEEDDED